MPVRITPQTALPAVRQLAAEAQRHLRQAGQLPITAGLEAGLAGIAGSAGGPILVDGALAQRHTAVHALDGRLGFSAPDDLMNRSEVVIERHGITFRLTPGLAPRPRRTGEPRAAVLVCLLGEEPPTAAETAAWEEWFEDRPVVLLGSMASSNGWISDFAGCAQRSASYVHVLDPGEPVMRFLDRWQSQADLLRAYSTATALESLLDSFSLALDEEFRSIRARRAVARQRASSLPQRATTTGSEAFGAIRALLQQQFGDFERGCGERFQNAIAAPRGEIWRDLEMRIESLQELVEEKRIRSVRMQIPPAFEDETLSIARQRLSAHMISDILSLRDLFRLVQEQVDQLAAKADGPALGLQFSFLAEDRIQKLVTSSVVLQSRFTGEQAVQGSLEHFMSARRYVTVFLMVASALGVSALHAYARIVIPASIVLLIAGVVAAVRDHRRQDAELRVRETEKAREFLRREFRRILQDAHRGWTALIAQHLSELSRSLLSSAELQLREFLMRRAAENDEEKQRLQRQLQALESAEKRLAVPVKGRDAVATDLAQCKGELRQLILAAAREQTGS